MTGAILYFSTAFLCWGFFMAGSPEQRLTNFVMAMIWPIAALLIVGYALGDRSE